MISPKRSRIRVTIPVANPIPYSPGRLNDSDIFIAPTVASADAQTFTRLFPMSIVMSN